MAVEDVIKLVKKVATEVIPDTITFTDVKVEASNVVLYTPNLEIFSDNNDSVSYTHLTLPTTTPV